MTEESINVRYEWYAMHRSKIEIMDELEKEKIAWGAFSRNIKDNSFVYVGKEMCLLAPMYFLTFNKNNHIKYLLSVLNSKFYKVFSNWYFPRLSDNSNIVRTVYLEQIPIPIPATKVEAQLEKLVDEILHLKALGKRTEILELQIDEIVYEMYDLNDEEIRYICKS